MRTRPLHHDLAGAKFFRAVNQCDPAGEAGEEQRLFHRRIAAADHRNLLAAEEKSVAGGATGDAAADQGLLAGQAQPARAGAAGDDQRPRADLLLAHAQGEGILAEIGVCNVRQTKLGPKAACLFAYIHHQLRPCDSFRPARKIFHHGGHGQLSARLVAFQYQRLKVGAASVDGGR